MRSPTYYPEIVGVEEGMLKFVRIPQGRFLVEIKDSHVWDAIKIGAYLRHIPLFEQNVKTTKAQKSLLKISPAEFLLILGTDPKNVLRMDEIREHLGMNVAVR